MLSALPSPAGDFGTYLTLATMRAMVYRAYMKSDIRLNATRIVAGLGGRDGSDQALAIRDWLEGHTEFLRDPDTAELLHAPDWVMRRILTQGTAYIDCDDVAMLAAALGKSVGLKARFTVVGFTSPKAPFRHVWTDLRSPSSPQWVDIDITRPAQDFSFNHVRRVLHVRV